MRTVTFKDGSQLKLRKAPTEKVPHGKDFLVVLEDKVLGALSVRWWTSVHCDCGAQSGVNGVSVCGGSVGGLAGMSHMPWTDKPVAEIEHDDDGNMKCDHCRKD